MWPRPHRRWDRVTAVLAERLADEATSAAPAPETLARRQAGPYDRWGRAYRWEASLAPGGAGLQVVATRTDGELHVWHIGNQGSHMFAEFELTLPAKATQERLVWLVASAAGINQSRTHHSPKSCSPATVSRVALLPTPTAARSRCRTASRCGQPCSTRAACASRHGTGSGAGGGGTSASHSWVDSGRCHEDH